MYRVPSKNRLDEEASDLLLTHLTDDVLALISRQLDAAALARIGATCRSLREIAVQPPLWHALLARACSSASKWSVREEQLRLVPREHVLDLIRDGAARLTRPGRRYLYHREVWPRSSYTPGDLAGAPVISSPEDSHFVLAADGLGVTYTGRVAGQNQAVRCDPPLPSAPFMALRAVRREPCSRSWDFEVVRATVAYFEVTILRSEEFRPTDCVAVGLGSKRFALKGKQPGWDRDSWGYHSDDGRFYHGSGTEPIDFGPTFKPGDTVGCGYSVLSHKIFFTHNGEFVSSPSAAKPAQLPLHPLIGIDTRAPLRLNFGQEPFCFNLDRVPPAVCERPWTSQSVLNKALQCFPSFGQSPPLLVISQRRFYEIISQH